MITKNMDKHIRDKLLRRSLPVKILYFVGAIKFKYSEDIMLDDGLVRKTVITYLRLYHPLFFIVYIVTITCSLCKIVIGLFMTCIRSIKSWINGDKKVRLHVRLWADEWVDISKEEFELERRIE